MKIFTLGEIMLRLSPTGEERLFQSPLLRAFFGGAEANVAVSLARFGRESFFVTRLPMNPIGEAALSALGGEGVRTEHVRRGGARLGIYFAELGADLRPMTVTYDRAGSAFAEMDPGELDWPAMLADAGWLHTTGITPALGPKALATTLAALEAARAAGVTVSFHVHYRPQLWTPAEARSALLPLMEHVDVLIANRGSLKNGLGVELPHGDLGSPAADLAEKLDLTHLAITLREALSASEHDWSAVLFERQRGEILTCRPYRLRLVDRVGAGDAFAAGLIYGLSAGWEGSRALAFAAAAGALKHTVQGDFNRVTLAEVERAME